MATRFTLPLVFLLAWSCVAQAGELIRSRADLDRHLREHAADTPINALTPGARERFLYSLRFGDHGLSSASGLDLGDELTQPQILAVMELFGPEAVAQAPQSHSDELRWLEKRVRSRDAIGDIERRYNEYFKAVIDIQEPDERARAGQRVAAFDRHLADLYRGRELGRVDDRELRLLRRAAQEVARSSPGQAQVDAFRAIFAERRRRDRVSSDDVLTMQSLWLASHRFADARRLASEFPAMKLPRLPHFRDSLGASPGQPTAWRFDATGRQLTREAVDLAISRILVTGSCDELRAVAEDIAADPVLGPAFERHSRWITQAPGIESLEAVREWNAQPSAIRLLMVYDRDEWSVLPAWGPAAIHVVKDGALADSIDWQQDALGRREKLVAALRRHGLLD